MIGHSVQLERKYSNSTLSHVTEPTVALRSSVADARGTLQLGYNEPDSGGSGGDSEKQDRETEKKSLRRQASLDNVSLSQLTKHSSGEEATAASVIASTSSAAATVDDGEQLMQQPQLQARKKTSFSALPNTTTWQQQQLIYQQTDNNGMRSILGSDVVSQDGLVSCAIFVFTQWTTTSRWWTCPSCRASA